MANDRIMKVAKEVITLSIKKPTKAERLRQKLLPAMKKAARPYVEQIRRELNRLNRDWQQEFGEPYPREIDDWKRWFMRLGFTGREWNKGEWTPDRLLPFIEGYLLRLQDQQTGQSGHASKISTPTGDNAKFINFLKRRLNGRVIKHGELTKFAEEFKADNRDCLSDNASLARAARRYRQHWKADT